MDRPTFEALKRIMERILLRAGDPQSLRDDWLQVAAWMQEVENAFEDLDTLGTHDPRRELRELR